MLRTLAPSAAALGLMVAAACGTTSDAGAGSAGGDVSQYVGAQQASANAPIDGDQSGGNARVASIDACALLTKEEIIGQIEASYPPDQLAAFRNNSGSWQILSNPEQRGTAKFCQYRFLGIVQSGDTVRRSDFKLAVVEPGFVNPNLNQAGKRPIAGIGDEAYFMSRGPMMPYARVGNVGVGIEGFPSTETDKAGAGLLRMAVARVR
ncbi:MAG TPA: hypothetical protein VJT85_03425 [Gemmatimonadaceae bacterium]|nr:hypothetical protein [Gemmatimonadaceae bacterium]